MTSETDAEFVADMEWLHSHDREAALPPEKLARLFALARSGAEAAARIERLEAALQYIAWEQKEGDEPHLIARAALEERT